MARRRNPNRKLETAYDTYLRRLHDTWGFDMGKYPTLGGAPVFARELARGLLQWDNPTFEKIRLLRRNRVKEHYKDYLRQNQEKNLGKSDKECWAEAVKLEADLFESRGWHTNKLGDWYDHYYRGYKTLEEKKEKEALFQEIHSRLERGESFLPHEPILKAKYPSDRKSKSRRRRK